MGRGDAPDTTSRDTASTTVRLPTWNTSSDAELLLVESGARGAMEKPEHDSWEPEEDISPDLIEAFEASHRFKAPYHGALFLVDEILERRDEDGASNLISGGLATTGGQLGSTTTS